MLTTARAALSPPVSGKLSRAGKIVRYRVRRYEAAAKCMTDAAEKAANYSNGEDA